MAKNQELVVITKTYDLILWSCQHTSRFPRNHRFVLGERIERNLYDLLEKLIQARYTRSRQSLLEQANLTLEILRFQMRLAKDLQCLKTGSYAFAAQAIDGCEKGVWNSRITVPDTFFAPGGWLKSGGKT
ncbi:MAG TPA: diversity-generating retroelement protein Avd [Gemmataceae bacterium]|nr:diversity-generating retroelement protein Avd [Gemmataceae bacterium]